MKRCAAEKKKRASHLALRDAEVLGALSLAVVLLEHVAFLVLVGARTRGAKTDHVTRGAQVVEPSSPERAELARV